MLITVRPGDGSSLYQVSTLEEVVAAIASGADILRADGSQYVLRSFYGGWLLDGCPINVVMGGAWDVGQKEALQAAGITCSLMNDCDAPFPSGIFRFVLDAGGGRVDTGATYPNCSQANDEACQPQQFTSMSDAIAYAYNHNETPYQVLSAEEAWDLAETRCGYDPGRVLAPVSGGGGILGSLDLKWVAIAAAAFLLLRGGRR